MIGQPLSKPELDMIQTSPGQSLLQLSMENPVMMVFLRHLGCVFCREALEDISAKRADIEEQGVKLVFVYMEEQHVASEHLEKFGLQDCIAISDPECLLYARFGLVKARFGQLLGFQSLIKGFQKGVDWSQFGGKAFGDAFQMPGIFIIYRGRVEDHFVHDNVWDRPDYLNLASCCAME